MQVDLYECEASLIYKASSRTVRATQRNLVSKEKKRKEKAGHSCTYLSPVFGEQIHMGPQNSLLSLGKEGRFQSSERACLKASAQRTREEILHPLDVHTPFTHTTQHTEKNLIVLLIHSFMSNSMVYHTALIH